MKCFLSCVGITQFLISLFFDEIKRKKAEEIFEKEKNEEEKNLKNRYNLFKKSGLKLKKKIKIFIKKRKRKLFCFFKKMIYITFIDYCFFFKTNYKLWYNNLFKI